MERLIIQNFGGIKKFTFEIKKINILIGPQATGKSIVAKLLYFFKQFDKELINAVNKNIEIKDFNNNLIKKFINFFPIHSFPNSDFCIRYEIDTLFIEIKNAFSILNKEIEINYSNFYKEQYISLKPSAKEEIEKKDDIKFPRLRLFIYDRYYRELKRYSETQIYREQIFIPAGRSFFANIQSNIFSLISLNVNIDPFLIEFGAIYERRKSIIDRNMIISNKYMKEKNAELFMNRRENILHGKYPREIDEMFINKMESILHSKYIRENENDYLLHKDGRKLEILNTSSGQQETLPLLLMLNYLFSERRTPSSIFIEEPEAHIYPSTQKSLVELIAMVFKFSNSRYQFVITTHSPYILTSFNNLIQAGDIRTKIEKKNEKDLSQLYDIVNKDYILSPNIFSAYNMDYDSIEDLIDPETKLISAEKLDSVSTDIAIQFERLLDLI